MLYNENIYEIPDHDDYPCKCGECGKEFPRSELNWSRDCHGITMRLLCVDCWHEIMDGIGYDGEYYTELDECLDYDY